MFTKLANWHSSEPITIAMLFVQNKPGTLLVKFPAMLDTNNLFNCNQVQTQHHISTREKNFLQAAEVIQEL